MASVQEIRQRLRGQRIVALRSSLEPLLVGRAGAEVWLFGSRARGDWDGRSDTDLLVVADSQEVADGLADALLDAGCGADVIALSRARWDAKATSESPHWRGIHQQARQLLRVGP
jgi:predicted nucleotidyltransferase